MTFDFSNQNIVVDTAKEKLYINGTLNPTKQEITSENYTVDANGRLLTATHTMAITKLHAQIESDGFVTILTDPTDSRNAVNFYIDTCRYGIKFVDINNP